MGLRWQQQQEERINCILNALMECAALGVSDESLETLAHEAGVSEIWKEPVVLARHGIDFDDKRPRHE